MITVIYLYKKILIAFVITINIVTTLLTISKYSFPIKFM